MTQNDISYYNARKTAQDAKLKRRETKRHNQIMEQLEQANVGANILGAQARMIGAEASAQSAKTNQEKFELDWAKEYGWSYGTPNDVVYNPDNYGFLDDDPSTGIVVPRSQMDSNHWISMVPQSYINKVREEQLIKAQTKQTTAGVQKTIWDTIKTGGQTVQIVIDTVGKANSTLGGLKDNE